MGYTHYWNKKERIKIDDWQQFATFAFTAIMKQTDAIRIVGGFGEPNTFPIIDENEVTFNGLNEESHETFSIERQYGKTSQFCKTAQKPYDTIVVACLLYAVEHGIIESWKSDGNAEDHKAGRRVYRKTQGLILEQ